MKRWFLAVPLLLFIGHGLFFHDYVVDDAAITFCYARNICSGFGPSLSPRGEIVEGISHPLWLILLLPFALVQLDLFLVAKLLGAFFALLALFLLTILPSIHFQRESKLSDTIAPSLLALNTGYVMWSLSGLENGLTAFLVTGLLWGIGLREWKTTTFAAICLSLTRPEGILLGLLALLSQRESRLKAVSILVGSLSLMLVFRYYIFSQWLPNTYWAKKGMGLGAMFSPVSPGWNYLFHSLTEAGLWPFILLALAGLYFCTKELRSYLSLFLLVTLIFPLWAGGDWMPCGRFLTPFFILLLLIGQVGLEHLMLSIEKKALRPLVLFLFVIWPLVGNYGSTANYSNHPTVHTKYRITRGKYFSDLSKRLHVARATVLEPDAGGVAWGGPNLEIIDLSGLCDLALARHHFRPRFFIPYVMEEKRPTFVHLHGAWTALCGLTTSSEFLKEYVPLSGKGLNWLRRSLVERKVVAGATPLASWENGIELMAINRPLPRELELIFRKTNDREFDTSLVLGSARGDWQDDTSILFHHFPPHRWSKERWYRSTHIIPPELKGALVIDVRGEGGGKKGMACPECTIESIRQLANSLPGDVSKVLALAQRIARSNDKTSIQGFIASLLRFANSNPSPPPVWWETLFLSLHPLIGQDSALCDLRREVTLRLHSMGSELANKNSAEADYQAFLYIAKAAKVDPKDSSLTSLREAIRSNRLDRVTKSLVEPLLLKIKENPQSSAPWKALGDLYLNEHLWHEAISAYEESLAWAAPAESGNLFVRLAACKYKAADLWGARRAGLQALESGAKMPPSLKEVLGI